MQKENKKKKKKQLESFRYMENSKCTCLNTLTSHYIKKKYIRIMGHNRGEMLKLIIFQKHVRLNRQGIGKMIVSKKKYRNLGVIL